MAMRESEVPKLKELKRITRGFGNNIDDYLNSHQYGKKKAYDNDSHFYIDIIKQFLELTIMPTYVIQKGYTIEYKNEIIKNLQIIYSNIINTKECTSDKYFNKRIFVAILTELNIFPYLTKEKSIERLTDSIIEISNDSSSDLNEEKRKIDSIAIRRNYAVMVKKIEKATDKVLEDIDTHHENHNNLPIDKRSVSKTKIQTQILLILDDNITLTHYIRKDTPQWLGIFIMNELNVIWEKISKIKSRDRQLISIERFLTMLKDIEVLDYPIHSLYFKSMVEFRRDENKSIPELHPVELNTKQYGTIGGVPITDGCFGMNLLNKVPIPDKEESTFV